MANSYKALTLALFLCLGSAAAHAGYAQAVPPAGWATGGGVGGTFGGAAANSATFANGAARANAILNVGGRAVTMPAAMRFAANAPRIAAATVFLNPALAGGIRVAGWLAAAGLAYSAGSGLWEYLDNPDNNIFPSSGTKYCSNWYNQVCYSSIEEGIAEILSRFPDAPGYIGSSCIACGKYVSHSVVTIDGITRIRVLNFRNNYTYTQEVAFYDYGLSSCPAGWYVTPAGCIQNAPMKSVTEGEFVEELTRHPMPDELPKEIPVPVELPEIAPVFFPTGDPVPNPKYNPQAEPSPENQPWTQPGVRLQPSPTPDSPWRIDIQPQNRPKPDAEPMPEPKPEEGGPGDTTPPGTEETPPGLCEQYPDILACAKLEQPEEEKLPEKDIGEQFQLEGGFSGGAACPAFPQIRELPGLSWQPFCDQLARIKPLVLAFAWLSAVFIILQYGRK